MARIIVFIVAAIAIFLLLWMLFWGLIHTLIIGFWVVLVAVLAVGMFRLGRRGAGRS
jgi:hypothetical protein